jgi:hypothetical protein
MGLDMCLEAEKYVGGWNHSKEAEKKTFNKILQAVDLSPDAAAAGSPSLHVGVRVAYWRKANHIHKWFVDNVQDGNDDTKRYYVSREQLEELMNLCVEVIATRDASKLPPQAGFFFGSTETNEWYWNAVEETAKRLRQVLDNEKLKDFSFYYRASW